MFLENFRANSFKKVTKVSSQDHILYNRLCNDIINSKS